MNIENELRLEFAELIKLIEREQDLKIEFVEGSTNEKVGMRERGDDGWKENNFFKLNFRVSEEEIRFTYLYLKKQKQGTGKKVIEWFVRFCNKKNKDSLLITGVNKSNIISVRCCEKFVGLWENEREDDNKTFVDYRIKISVL